VEKNSNFFTFLWLFGGAVKKLFISSTDDVSADFPKDLLKR
tara:strand:- start:886 stop:1008 length:123 start_codon:yes stop_codon:yes gene_type:complete